ncbi:MAG: thiolase family protein [Albidovulum sp.]
MTASFIVAARRSAVVPKAGAFAHLSYFDLAAPVIKACLQTCGLTPDDVDELVAGNALGAGGNPARLMALAAGLPERVAGLSIDRQCCSGLDALNLADSLIRSGRAQIVVAGGAESYSRRPLRLRTFANGAAPEPYEQAAFTPWPSSDPDMAGSANQLAEDLGISRASQDGWAALSHEKALAARDAQAAEIVEIAGVRHDVFARDLTPGLCKRATTITGNITSANAAVAADAAAFCVVVSEAVAKRLDVPMLRLVGGLTLGGRPDCPGLAPVAAIRAVLDDAKIGPGDIGVAEIMEAYAVQAIACVYGAGLDEARVNLGGGALARGHPIGASGAINAVRLYHELTVRGGYGLAAIAAAGGLGTAVLLHA